MIDIENAKIIFKQFLEEYKNQDDLGFDLKVIHTYHVTENARKLAQGLDLEQEEIENSTMSETVYNSIKKLECVKLTDRKTPLDYWTCVLAFIFDLNFSTSYKIVKENNYVNHLIDRFDYKIQDTKQKMEKTKKIIKNYIDEKNKIYS